ncbi:MAG: hypothetical protein H7210_13180 [Pyrinomonadaceae bacterium]|nr:hypothetical protein [Phycisphaerales bacterium]
MNRKPYRAKSLRGAQTYVRALIKQVDHMTKLFEEAHAHRTQLAKLSATGPAFYNPIEATNAQQVRDEILRAWCKMKPDGSPL